MTVFIVQVVVLAVLTAPLWSHDSRDGLDWRSSSRPPARTPAPGEKSVGADAPVAAHGGYPGPVLLREEGKAADRWMASEVIGVVEEDGYRLSVAQGLLHLGSERIVNIPDTDLPEPPVSGRDVEISLQLAVPVEISEGVSDLL